MKNSTIRIRKSAAGEWQAVKLVHVGVAWVLVDDGLGRLWVMRIADQIHPDDLKRLIYKRLPRGE